MSHPGLLAPHPAPATPRSPASHPACRVLLAPTAAPAAAPSPRPPPERPWPPLPPSGAPSASGCSRARLRRPLGETGTLAATFPKLDLSGSKGFGEHLTFLTLERPALRFSWGWVHHTPLMWPRNQCAETIPFWSATRGSRLPCLLPTPRKEPGPGPQPGLHESANGLHRGLRGKVVRLVQEGRSFPRPALGNDGPGPGLFPRRLVPACPGCPLVAGLRPSPPPPPLDSILKGGKDLSNTFWGAGGKEITNMGARDTPVVVHPSVPVTRDAAWGSQEGCACLVALYAQTTTRDTVEFTVMSYSALASGSPSKQALPPTAAPAAAPQPECPWTPRQGHSG